jgi:hypothetical protein
MFCCPFMGSKNCHIYHNFTFRFIDDVLSLNISTFGDFVDRMYNFISLSLDFNLITRNIWTLGSVVSLFLSRKSWWEPQALEYRINWERYTPYADATGMLLHITTDIASYVSYLGLHLTQWGPVKNETLRQKGWIFPLWAFYLYVATFQ